MSDSLNDLINNQRRLACIGTLSQELQFDRVKERQAEQKSYAYWNEEISLFSQGYRNAIAFLETNPEVFTYQELREGNEEHVLTLEECLITDADLEIFANDQIVSELLTGNSTLQNLWNKSKKVLIAYYVAAKSLFEQQRFTESMTIFSLLTILNQNVASFWIGKGASDESLENWDKAIANYWMAQSINQEDPETYKGLIRIYKLLKDDQSLLDCFEIIGKHPNVEMLLLRNEEKGEENYEY